MAEQSPAAEQKKNIPWWKSFGPALITACVVLGPGSLLVSSNIGANYRYELTWLFVLTGILMGTYVIMSMRIGTIGGATPCTLIARHIGRPFAVIIALNLCLITAAFQFGNNLAFATAANSLGIARLFGNPEQMTEQTKTLISCGVLLVINALILVFIFTTTKVYHAVEKLMKFMVGIMVFCFVANLIVARPDILGIIKGLVPSMPEGLTFSFPKKIAGAIQDPMILVASLLGTTFSLGGAFFQGNLVREKGWTIDDCKRGAADAVFGIGVLTAISMIIMITTATVIYREPATDIGVLAKSLKPLLGTTSYIIFCIGLLAVSMNPFLINVMIGGSILADGLGKPPKLSDPWPRRFTALLLIIGMIIAMLALKSGRPPINLIIFGQALTVLGNPLMAATILWMANKKAIMGDRRNKIILNVLGGIGFIVVIFMAARVLYRIVLQLT